MSTMTIYFSEERTSLEPARARPASAPLTMTLYDLVAAVQDILGPERDDQVVATVSAVLRAGHVTWNPTPGTASYYTDAAEALASPQGVNVVCA